MVDQQPPAARPRSRTRLVVQAVFSLALVVVLFYYLLKDVDLAQVWAEIQAMTWMEDAALLAIAAWNLATYGLLWMSVTPGLRFGRAMVMTQSASAVTNTVPTVGPAIGVGLTYSMLRSWGYSGSRISVAVLVSGVWNTFAKLGLPVLALALLALQGNASGARVTLALAGIGVLVAAIVVFALLLRSEQLAERFGLLAGRVASRLLRLIRRPPVHGWELATVRFRTRTLELLEHGWLPITAATLVSHLSLYLVLLACLRAVGVSDAEVSWAQVLVAFAFMRLITIVPFTPGSAGVAELALIAPLVAAGGDREQVTAAVLVYRALTWGLQIPVGVACYLWWRRSQRRTQPATPAGTPQVATPEAAAAASKDQPDTHTPNTPDRQPRPRAYVRHPSDVLRVVLGALILLATMTAIHQHRIGVREANLFRLINDLALPGWTRWPVWGVMQLGVIGAVPLVAGLALLTRRIRLAAYAALAGGTIYLVAKLVKEFVQRGRPQTLLDNVYIFDVPDRGLGYVSGHSAVAVALATVASPFLGRRARRVAWTLAGLVCVARIYVGSHLPFDVLGGAALGWAAGALVLLVFGAPTGQPSLERVRTALQDYGFDPADLAPLKGEDRRSAGYLVSSHSRPDLFVKVVTRERRDSDLLYRAWYWLRHRGRPPSRLGDASPRSSTRPPWGCWPPRPGCGPQRCCWCGPSATAPACSSSSACTATI
jgi:putative heme transporter